MAIHSDEAVSATQPNTVEEVTEAEDTPDELDIEDVTVIANPVKEVVPEVVPEVKDVAQEIKPEPKKRKAKTTEQTTEITPPTFNPTEKRITFQRRINFPIGNVQYSNNETIISGEVAVSEYESFLTEINALVKKDVGQRLDMVSKEEVDKAYQK